jgi:phage baseplate assembly protein W
MRPDFGCGVHDYVFASVDATTAGLIAFDVRAALTRWEPRIEIEDIIVTPEAQADGDRLLIDIQYTIRGSNDPRNLVFPFYAIPEE